MGRKVNSRQSDNTRHICGRREDIAGIVKPLVADGERSALRGISSRHAAGVAIGPIGNVRVSRFSVRLFLQGNQVGCHATEEPRQLTGRGDVGDVGGF